MNRPRSPGARGPGGRFQPGRSGNPSGRPRKPSTVGEAVRKALDAPVVVTEGGKRMRISKREAAAAQMANKSASGDLRAGKLAFELAHKAEERDAATPSAPPPLSASDEEIVARLVARLRLIDQHKESSDEPDYSI